MFNGCQSLKSVNFGNINITLATNLSAMFYNCYALTELDLSKWETTKATNMSQMFCNCRALTKLDIRNFTFTKVTSYNNMFKDVPADCLIIVKDDTTKEWVLARRSDLTNVKTVAELEG
jgi:surface protein